MRAAMTMRPRSTAALALASVEIEGAGDAAEARRILERAAEAFGRGRQGERR
jgi:hypothetical protein